MNWQVFQAPFPLDKRRTVGSVLIMALATLLLFVLFKKIIIFSLMLLAAIISPWFINPSLFFALVISHESGFFASALFLLLVNAFAVIRYGIVPSAFLYLSLAALILFITSLMRNLSFATVAIPGVIGYHAVGTLISTILGEITPVNFLLASIWVLINIFYIVKLSGPLSSLLS